VLPLEPMLLSAADSPPAADDEFGYEVKWDGMRALCRVDEATIAIWSRRGNDFTGAFPELRGLTAALRGRSAVLDGEIVCMGPNGRTSFNSIRRRWAPGTVRSASLMAQKYPATFVAFDLLEIDGHRVIDESYERRRDRLAQLELASPNWITTGYHVGNGHALLKASREQGLEGIVAKRLRSRYRPGARTSDWLKIKNYQRQTFVVVGWLPASGGGVEALLVGTRQEQAIAFAGTVEFGLGRQRTGLVELLESLAVKEPPFAEGTVYRKARYVQPRLHARVRFVGRDAGVLREALLERILPSDS
jgi:bifunctional non-homologous end joining protein LigD